MKKIFLILIIILLATACTDNQVINNDKLLVSNQNSEKEKKSFCKDMCGDGICAQMVCMAEGCPCAENKENCPEDCTDE